MPIAKIYRPWWLVAVLLAPIAAFADPVKWAPSPPPAPTDQPSAVPPSASDPAKEEQKRADAAKAALAAVAVHKEGAPDPAAVTPKPLQSYFDKGTAVLSPDGTKFAVIPPACILVKGDGSMFVDAVEESKKKDAEVVPFSAIVALQGKCLQIVKGVSTSDDPHAPLAVSPSILEQCKEGKIPAIVVDPKTNLPTPFFTVQ